MATVPITEVQRSSVLFPHPFIWLLELKLIKYYGWVQATHYSVSHPTKCEKSMCESGIVYKQHVIHGARLAYVWLLGSSSGGN